ncbi:heat-shock protein Hsp70 [Parafrankia soli]|uniref:Heat-shock protein Hsp70 n=1 Tax=Parafrankia soli TaxID=2599596 RepID=A0A1S1PWN1_9ACTN|nr:Hsp70 family protein [Parafrankia soli]OHV25719.1 heat-shock protein Hsp70 [Parafrankia soli]
MAYALGIDVGTTFTAGAIWRDGRAEAFGLGTHSTAVPSVLFLRDDGVMLVGEAAEQRAVTEPSRVAREFKRRFGDDVPVLLGDTWVTATELFADMIRFVVGKVTERESEAPGYVMLTCPATWSDHRRGLMEDAAGLAGLGQVGLVAEPTAAAMYYAAQERLEPGALLGIYDLGGGTFDATVLRKTAGGFELCGDPGGDDEIGGVDVDQAVVDHIARAVGPSWHEQDTSDPATARALAAVLAAAVTAKETLSQDLQAEIPVILPGCNKVVRITRDDLEDAVRILVLRTVDAFRRTVRAAGVEVSDLARVLLVGGSSRIPLIARMIEDDLRVPVAVDTHPKLAVCLGAAIAAGPRVATGALGAAAPGTAAGPAPWTAPPVGTPPSPRPADAPAPRPGAPQPAPWPDGTSAGVPTGGPGDEPTDVPRRVPEPVEATAARRAADLVAPAPAGPPGGARSEEQVRLDVDLAGAGLAEPSDQPLRPAVMPTRAVRLADRDVPLVVRTAGDASYRQAGRRTAAVLGAVAVVAVLAAAAIGVLLGLGGGSAGPEPPPRTTAPGVASTAAATARVARLAGAPLPAGGSGGGSVGAALAVAVRPGGGLVAVGATGSPDPAGRTPSAWWTGDGTTWRLAAVPLPAGATVGTMSGLASTGGRLVAVGWVGSGDTTSAAVWVSDDGQAWRAGSVGGAASSSMRDVVARAGGLLAVGQDDGSDPEGDGAVWTSADGSDWQRVDISGADGLGTQTLHRVVSLAGGGLLATGQEPEGAGTVARVRQSADGSSWTGVETDLPLDAEVAGLAILPDGRLVGAGSVPHAGGRQQQIWVADATGRSWAPQDALTATGQSGTGIDIAGVAVAGTLVAAGSIDGTDGPAAASWSVTLDQPR